MEGHWNFQGEEGSDQPNSKKRSMNLNWNSRGGGAQFKPETV